MAAAADLSRAGGSMTKIRRIDFSPDEFLVGVAGMKPEEIGAYWIACSLMYSRGGPIPDDETWIARACGCHWRTWRRIKARLIEVGKLRETPEGLINDRVVKELEKARGRLKSSADAAQKSAEERGARAAQEGSETAQDGRRNGAGRAQDGLRNAAQLPQEEPEAGDFNNLDEAAAQFPDELTINHQPSTIKFIGENYTVGPAAAGPPAAENLAGVIFNQGVAWLQRSTGKSDRTCRTLLGKWRKDFDDDAAMIAALGAAQREGPINAVEWMEGAIRARTAPTYRPMGAAPWNG
jgi:uncharacterized protein YdaU (DUF1376 family)